MVRKPMGARKIAFLLGNDVSTALAANQFIPHTLNSGGEVEIWIPKIPTIVNAAQPDMQELAFWEREILNGVVSEFIDEKYPRSTPNSISVPLRRLARDHEGSGVTIREVEDINDPAFIASLGNPENYLGAFINRTLQIAHDDLIEFFKGEVYNNHPGLLPQRKGLTSNFWALVNEDESVGWTAHRVIYNRSAKDQIHESREARADALGIDGGNILALNARRLDHSLSALEATIETVPDAVKNATDVISNMLDPYKTLAGYPQDASKANYNGNPSREQLAEIRTQNGPVLVRPEEMIRIYADRFALPGDRAELIGKIRAEVARRHGPALHVAPQTHDIKTFTLDEFFSGKSTDGSPLPERLHLKRLIETSIYDRLEENAVQDIDLDTLKGRPGHIVCRINNLGKPVPVAVIGYDNLRDHEVRRSSALHIIAARPEFQTREMAEHLVSLVAKQELKTRPQRIVAVVDENDTTTHNIIRHLGDSGFQKLQQLSFYDASSYLTKSFNDTASVHTRKIQRQDLQAIRAMNSHDKKILAQIADVEDHLDNAEDEDATVIVTYRNKSENPDELLAFTVVTSHTSIEDGKKNINVMGIRRKEGLDIETKRQIIHGIAQQLTSSDVQTALKTSNVANDNLRVVWAASTTGTAHVASILEEELGEDSKLDQSLVFTGKNGSIPRLTAHPDLTEATSTRQSNGNFLPTTSAYDDDIPGNGLPPRSGTHSTRRSHGSGPPVTRINFG